MLTREQAQAVYDEGRDAIVTLVLEFSTQVDVLAERVKDLEARLNKNSRNSHKPPSSDGLARRRVQTREKSGKRSGGQVGHPGATLQMVETPDLTERHLASACPGCGGSLAVETARVIERRQVIDLPAKLLEVVEHQVLEMTCPGCQAVVRGEFPAGVTQPVQYGDGVKSLGVYLQAYQLLPYERSAEMLSDVFGAAMSEGTLDNTRGTSATNLVPVEAAIKTAITGAPVVQFDETGARVAGQTQWLHNASTSRLTYYQVHPKRGTEAMDAIGILPAFGGTAVHDCLASYFGYGCQHGVCGAHLLRELKAVAEEGPAQVWAADMRTLLVSIKDEVGERRDAGEVTLDARRQAAFAQTYDDLIIAGHQANPRRERLRKWGRVKQTPATNLVERMAQRRDAVLMFMRDFRVPFDNNLSERDLRMMKVKQKVSGCFRSAEGAAAFCRIRGYISTLRKQGLPVLTSLRTTFTASPLMPDLET
jgi:transposase